MGTHNRLVSSVIPIFIFNSRDRNFVSTPKIIVLSETKPTWYSVPELFPAHLCHKASRNRMQNRSFMPLLLGS